MTDVSAPEDFAESVAPSLDPAVQAELDAIRAEKQARIDDVLKAQAAEDERLAEINAVKKEMNDQLGPINDAHAATEDPHEKEALAALMNKIHAEHPEWDEAVWKASGQRKGDANPASPGVNQIESGVAVMGDASA